MSKTFDTDAAIVASIRRDNLAFAEQCGAWVIRKHKTLRVRSRNELERRVSDSATCFHGVSYTMKCRACRRSVVDAQRNLESLKLKLSIT